MTKINRVVLQEDFAEFQFVFTSFLQTLLDDDWGKPTGKREKDWTVHQTLAHLLAIGELLEKAVDAALNQTPVTIDGLAQREDLRTWNENEIIRLTHHTPQALIERFLSLFQNASEKINSLSDEQFQLQTETIAYNRPAKVIDFIDWQLSHPGIVHAAQITRPSGHPPLWELFSGELIHRQIDRFLRSFSSVYWNILSDETTVMNFHVEGENGGSWQIIANPEGGEFHRSASENADYNLHFTQPEILFGIFTVHLPIMEAIQSGDFRVEEDPMQLLNIIRLFSPTPPKL